MFGQASAGLNMALQTGGLEIKKNVGMYQAGNIQGSDSQPGGCQKSTGYIKSVFIYLNKK